MLINTSIYQQNEQKPRAYAPILSTLQETSPLIVGNVLYDF